MKGSIFYRFSSVKYQIIGIVMSLALLLVGFIEDIEVCLIGGLVFLMCNVGSVIGYRLRNNRKRLLPVIIMIAAVATVVVSCYVYCLHTRM